jgi:hypothetical protein
VRIAISGTHVTGKSTLVAELGARLHGYATVPEPYELLEERGYEFEFPPSIKDYVMQMRQSIALLRRRPPNVIFDRCPLDFIAYIFASRGAERFDPERWREPILTAMARLDLIVAVRIDPEHDPVGSIEDAAFRREVDAEFDEILEGDSLGLCGGVDVLPVRGPWDGRAEAVCAYLTRVRSAPGAS